MALLHVAKTLASGSELEMFLGVLFWWQGEHDLLKGSKVSFCEIVFMVDFGHDDDCGWQAQHFGCLRRHFSK